MAKGTFEFLDHTADVAVRLVAPGLAELFAVAVDAALAIYVEAERMSTLETNELVPVRLQAEDAEALLVDFLNEIVYLFDAKQYLPARLEDVRIESSTDVVTLQGTLCGATVDLERFPLNTEIKSATQHNLEIRQVAGGLQADVVFDL